VIAKAEPCKYEINNELVYQTNLHTQNCLPLYLIDLYNRIFTFEQMGPLYTRQNNTNTRYKKKTE
jgi:hypothetical protein